MTPTREKFNKALEFIQREGKLSLLIWLEEETDFFTAPSSTAYHGNFIEGLLQHSVNVLEYALHNFNMLVKKKPEYEYLRESVIICSLFHDVCKTNQYKITEKWTKDANNKWMSYQGYEVNDKFPIGHGVKSVVLLSKYIKLTNEEIMAIIFHMGAFDISPTIANYNKMSFEQASKECPLVRLIMASDLLAIISEQTVDYKAAAK